MKNNKGPLRNGWRGEDCNSMSKQAKEKKPKKPDSDDHVVLHYLREVGVSGSDV